MLVRLRPRLARTVYCELAGQHILVTHPYDAAAFPRLGALAVCLARFALLKDTDDVEKDRHQPGSTPPRRLSVLYPHGSLVT